MNEHQTMHRWTVSLFAIPVFVLSVCLTADGSIFVETFDNGNVLGTQDAGAQIQSGLDIGAAGDILGWTKSTGGTGTVHGVDRIAGAGIDLAAMIYSGSEPVTGSNAAIITLTNGIAANDLGTVYAVDFEVSAAVYKIGAQITTASDALLIEILRSDDSILSSYNSSPGAWAGTMAFHDDSFAYTGDGNGLVRIRVSSAFPDSDRFAGHRHASDLLSGR